MKQQNSNVVICGAGMVGLATAYHLVAKHGIKNVVLVDEREPLTLTSDKGTGAYRNWWPGPGDTMVRFINRSIDLLEEIALKSNNVIGLNRRGYLYFTADPQTAESMKKTAEEISALGAGPLRIHHNIGTYLPSQPEGIDSTLTGADLLWSQAEIHHQFPYITSEVVTALHVRRCGFVKPKELGNWLLEQFLIHGGQLLRDRVERVEVVGNQVKTVKLSSGSFLHTNCLVIAAGPYLKRVGTMLGLDLPVFSELHGKIVLKDTFEVVPEHAPLLIWNDPVTLPWSKTELRELESREADWMMGEFPAGVHVRPRGSGTEKELMIIWTYHPKPQEVVWPPTFDADYPEILIRALSRMLPKMEAYFGFGKMASVDGGYYCKTKENRPVIGPLPVDGAYVAGALSGFGIMGSQAAGDLLACYLSGSSLPDYAGVFRLDRYQNPQYQQLLANWDATTGQL